MEPDGSAITCGLCGLKSHHPDDVAARYCGNCKIFHDDRSRWCAGGCGVVLVELNGRLPKFCSRCADRR